MGALYRCIEIKSTALEFILLLAAVGGTIVNGLSGKDAYSGSFQILILIAFLFSLVLFGRNTEPVKKDVGKRIIDHMSAYSYSLYLLHYSIIKLIIVLPVNCSVYIKAVVAILISNLTAYFFAQIFEAKESPIIKMCTKIVCRKLHLDREM